MEQLPIFHESLGTIHGGWQTDTERHRDRNSNAHVISEGNRNCVGKLGYRHQSRPTDYRRHSRHTGYRHHSCHTRAKNWTVFFFMCPKTLSEDELKSNGLIWQKNFQVTETLRLWHSCWSLLIAMFTSENQNNAKNTSIVPRAKAAGKGVWTKH